MLCLNGGESVGFQIAWQFNCGFEYLPAGAANSHCRMPCGLYAGPRKGREIHGGEGGIIECRACV